MKNLFSNLHSTFPNQLKFFMQIEIGEMECNDTINGCLCIARIKKVNNSTIAVKYITPNKNDLRYIFSTAHTYISTVANNMGINVELF